MKVRQKMKRPSEDPLDSLILKIVGARPIRIRIDARFDVNSPKRLVAVIGRRQAAAEIARRLVVLVMAQSTPEGLKELRDMLAANLPAKPAERLRVLTDAAHRLIGSGRLVATSISEERVMRNWEITCRAQ